MLRALSAAVKAVDRERTARTAHVRRFARDLRGNVAITFGLSLIPLSIATGAALDYTNASLAKTKLDAIADAAALVAVNSASMDETAANAEKIAKDFFNAQASAVKSANLGTVSVNIKETTKGRSSTVTYQAAVPTTLIAVIGVKDMAVGGSAIAASAQPTYIDFHLLLDNTPSMGLGATTKDIATLVAKTPDQCAFACHDESAGSNDYYALAKKIGAQMRIDVVRQATQKLMDTATETATVKNQFRMALHTFGPSAQKAALTTIQTLTTNLSTAKTSASAIDLMSIPYQNYKSDTQTDFHDVLGDMNTAISTPGDGSKSTKPQKILFFVSDGLGDRAVGSPSCVRPTTDGADAQTGQKFIRCIEPLSVSLCTTIKNRGVKIAVLYTTYLPLPTNSWYVSQVQPFANDIGTNMKNCASPDLYFEVSPTEGISEAMTALFQKVVQQARLTE